MSKNNDSRTVKIPIASKLFIPNLLANNNPPPIVKTHIGHIVYDKIYCQAFQTQL